MDKFKCVGCGHNDVEHEDDLCDECFYEAEEDEDMEEE